MGLAQRKQPGITSSCSGKCQLEDILNTKPIVLSWIKQTAASQVHLHKHQHIHRVSVFTQRRPPTSTVPCQPSETACQILNVIRIKRKFSPSLFTIVIPSF
jgi:hypothetical protein